MPNARETDPDGGLLLAMSSLRVEQLAEYLSLQRGSEIL